MSNPFGARIISQLHRAPDNPMDKCTIVSMFPVDIEERKHTIQPGIFRIPAGNYDKPSLLLVKPASWWKEMEEGQPALEIVNSSIQVANSVVADYMQGLMCCDGGNVTPALFFVPGEFNLGEILTKHKGMLDKYKANQSRWYAELIKLADSLWAKSNGDPLSVNDLMRLAARELGQNNKDWLAHHELTETVRCVACGALRNPIYPICGNCKTNVPEFISDQAMIKSGKVTKTA